MKLTIKKGETSKIMQVFIQDSSATTGAGLTGLVYNTASLTAYYIREGDASATEISLVTATVGTYTSGGFKEVDSTNMPGVYELDLPNACLADGAEQVIVFLKGATNMAPLPIEIQLRDNTEKDIYDRLGSPIGASISADIVTVDGITDNIKTQTDKMNFTGDDIKATLDGEEVTTDTASRTASKATGFSVPNEYDTELTNIKTEVDKVQTGIIDTPNSYKADVTNLDVAVSTRNNITPPTTGEIKTELEGTGTKLTEIKNKTDTIDWTDITKILQIEQGRWKIENNQMTFFSSDGVTPLLTFNLKDSLGQATETSVFERTPV